MALLQIVPADVTGILRLIGELDISNVEATQARLEEGLRGRKSLSLDTSELAFIDSQGIRMLIILGEQALAQGSTVSVLNCSKPVRRALEVAVPHGIPGVEISQVER